MNGMLVAVAMCGLCFMAVGQEKTTMQEAMEAYGNIKGDVVEAERVQAMFAAIPDNALALSYVGRCLKIQRKYADAVVAFNAALALETIPHRIILYHVWQADACYSVKKYADGVSSLKTCLAAIPDDARYNKRRADCLVEMARGLRCQGRYAESNEAIIESIMIRMRSDDANAAQNALNSFSKLRLDEMDAASYQKALQNIIKAVPAVEANAEFLGRVKSELEKMR